MNIRKKFDLARRMLAFVAAQRLPSCRKYDPEGILFISDVRDGMGGNFECVLNALDKDKWHIDTFLKDKQLHRETVSDAAVIARKLRAAKYIFLEDVFNYLQFYTPLPGQEIIQLWHGEGAYKKFGFSRTQKDIKISTGHKKYTKAIVSAPSIRGCYAEGYGIDIDKVIATGIPRTDAFYDEEWKASVRKSFREAHPEVGDRKIILLAPTYRGTKISQAHYDMSEIPLAAMEEEFGRDYVLVTKMHPAAYNNALLEGRTLGDGRFWIDISDVRDVNDVLPAADILITDYSSIIFNWALLDRPVVYYVFDRSDYESDRGLYYPFDDYVYGAVAQDKAGLMEALRRQDMMPERRKVFLDRFMSSCDGHSSERVLELL